MYLLSSLRYQMFLLQAFLLKRNPELQCRNHLYFQKLLLDKYEVTPEVAAADVDKLVSVWVEQGVAQEE